MENVLNWIAQFISAVGAINWGFYKFLKINPIELLFGLKDRFFIKTFTYLLITSAGFYLLFTIFSVKNL